MKHIQNYKDESSLIRFYMKGIIFLEIPTLIMNFIITLVDLKINLK
jgi:hypothetical protein